MKTTKLIAICATVSVLVQAPAALAGPAVAIPVILGARVLAQDQPLHATSGDRREVESLLWRARQAMKNGDLDVAESLLSRAEAMKVEFNVFHLGDTPKKARHDLDLAKQRAKRSAPALPSEKAKAAEAANPPSSRREKDATSPDGAPKKPLLSQPLGDATGPPSEETLSAIPSLARPDKGMQRAIHQPVSISPEDDGADPNPRLAGNATPSDTAANLSRESSQGDAPGGSKTAGATGDRRQSDTLLLAARRALAVGDVRRATEYVEQAKRINAHYEFQEDAPAKVEAMLRRYKDVVDARPGREETEGWRHQYCELLMDQAQQLLRWRDFDEAERLTQDAARMRVSYGPFEAKPDALLERIAVERKKNQVAGGATNNRQLASAAAEAERAPSKAISPAMADKERATLLTRQARGALVVGSLDQAEQLARQAEAIGVPERAFAADDDSPTAVLVDIQRARARGAAKNVAGPAYPTTRAGYDPAHDPTHNRGASYEEGQPEQLPAMDAGDHAENVDPLPPVAAQSAKRGQGAQQPSEARILVQEGEQALHERDIDKARECFTRAYALRRQLDPSSVQRLQDHLQMLSAPQSRSGAPAKPSEDSLLDAAAAKAQLLAKQLSAEVVREQTRADKVHEQDPKQARELLTQAREKVEQSEVDAQHKALLLARIDRSLGELDKYIEANRAQISLDSQNKEVMDKVERLRHRKIEVQEKLAKLVNEYNQLIDDRRYPEAEVLAKRASEMDPQNPVVVQLVRESSLIRRTQMNNDLIDRKERAAWDTFNSVENAAIPYDDSNPIQFPDVRKWEELSKSPQRRATEGRAHRTERELEIERKLKTPVSCKFRNRPLSEVLEHLARLAAVNLYLDPQGLAEESVPSDNPVTIDLPQDISLKSALNLILEPLHLSFVIKDEVLKITSEQLRDRQMFPVTYSVADLVIPIPNFVPNNRMGLPGALADAYNSAPPGVVSNVGLRQTALLASRDGTQASGVINPAVLSQMGQMNPMNPMMSGQRQGQPGNGFGPGGTSGGAQADFDSLIDLITSTISPDTWGDAPGQGSIKPFETNLSLVISHTQDVHDQIADLLKQLRKLQDLQVTIEVRFITLNDDFFERIGVDFQFNIQSDTINPNVQPATGGVQSPSMTVGLLAPAGSTPFPNFTSDLSIPFRQSSYSIATPPFGQPQDVADFGFAILSNLEAYFLVSAAQGDQRSNVLQAPKVTLFNGQQATVSDTTQVPFVISVIPVVGDFAAANQPVIVVLSEGTFLSVQAVVSNDKRFVRLTVVPFFSNIGNVQEFTFSGSSTTTTNTSNSNATTSGGDDSTAATNNATTSSNGVTVQLPSFSFVTVTTTVSVPDGGTVLLGGIKRLSEGRNEFGVPILSKLPYINRLFKNVGIGRETESLMMMVTPRIIIQEEEEEKLGIAPTAAP